MAESPKVSEQALLVYKSIIDQFDIIKKQQWAMRWLRLSEQNFRVDKWSLCRG